jgi:hypothetical protein
MSKQNAFATEKNTVVTLALGSLLLTLVLVAVPLFAAAIA